MIKYSTMNKGEDVYINDIVSISCPDLATIGNHVAIDFGFVCTTRLTVGDYVHISPHVSVIGGRKSSLIMDDFSFISTGARIVCTSEEFLGEGLVGPLIPDKYRDNLHTGTVILSRFSGVCANSIVMPGVLIEEGSVLGANSFLKESTEPWTIYAGSPARPIKKRKKENLYRYAGEMGYEF